ncbi:MAG: hypothetical protein ACJAVS_001056 [Paracoccaceae bacterium]|jgi:hypothetical protein
MKVDRSGHRADAGPDIALLRKKMIVGVDEEKRRAALGISGFSHGSFLSGGGHSPDKTAQTTRLAVTIRGGSVCLNNFRAFLSGFPPRLRCRCFGRLRVEAGLIGGFPVKG